MQLLNQISQQIKSHSSMRHAYDRAIIEIDKAIRDREVSTILFVQSSIYFFGDADEALDMIDAVYAVYVQLINDGWSREKAIEIGIPVACACYKKDKDDHDNMVWMIIYAVVIFALIIVFYKDIPINF